ncbi:hypothetical protein [Clostridium novyi]|nr:hypothetical protein [Clostridium novyi]
MIEQDIISCAHFQSYSEIIKNIGKHSFYSKLPNRLIRITQKEVLKLPIDSNIKIHYNGNKVVHKESSTIFEYIDISIINSYLNSPLYIVVENKDSDGKFIRSIYNFITNNNATMQDLELSGKLKIVHGGGGNVGLVLETYVLPCRLICLVDSDKKYPQDSLQRKDGLRIICDECGHDFIILSRREIENYIPDKALISWQKKQQSYNDDINMYFDLDNKQKSYFDLKKGLKIKDFKDHRIRELYSNIYDKYEEVINKGFQCNNVLNKEILKGFGSNVYNAFDEIAVCTKEDLKDFYDELNEIVELINNRI